MTVLMFKPQFAGKIASGKKRQTIRPPRKRPLKPGDDLSLRRWTGLPYRSPQEVLANAVVHSVDPITIRVDGFIEMRGRTLSVGEMSDLARNDGFATTFDFLAYFSEQHALPFDGILIQW